METVDCKSARSVRGTTNVPTTPVGGSAARSGRRGSAMTAIAGWPDGKLLESLARAAFEYFPLNSDPRNGLVADTSRENSPCSIAVVGFAFAAWSVAAERGWVERPEAVRRILAALRFFRDSDQSGSTLATGFKGFYYHFLDMQTGVRAWRSELSMVDTALLIAGALTARMYFDAPSPDETELRELAETLYRRIDWRWA